MDDRQGMSLKSRAYDFILVITTIAVLSLLGLICLYGTIYSFNRSMVSPEWTQTFEYSAYFGMMNTMVIPFTLILLAVMALCIPRRIIPRRFLFPLGIVMLFSSFGVAVFYGAIAAISLIIGFSAFVQVFVAYAVVKGSKYLVFEKSSTIEKFGSTVLHLGLLIFILDLVALQDSPLHIGIFWVATALITVGSLFIFYPDNFKKARL